MRADLDGIFRRVAPITGVQQGKFKALRGLLLSAQQEAFRAHGVGRRKQPTVKDVRRPYARLRKSLEALQRERKGEFAGIYLCAVIAPQSIDDWLDAVARAERHAVQSLPGVISVKMLGGELKCQRMSGTDYDKIKGSFADLLALLRDYLPDGFIPESAHSIADKITARINRPFSPVFIGER